MIKLEVEIENEIFKFNYQIGTSKHFAEIKLDDEKLCAFTQLLHILYKWNRYDSKEHRENIIVEARVKDELDKMKKE